MKVSDIEYKRVTIEEISAEMEKILAKITGAKSVDDLLAAREDYVALFVDAVTAFSLSNMRYTINTVDEFYLKEKDYYDEYWPQIEKYAVDYGNAILNSPFKAEFEKQTNPLLVKSYEVAAKGMSPEIIQDMVEENKIVTEYSQLMAGLMVEFRGETMPRTLLQKYFKDDDRETRREAYDAFGKAMEAHSTELDDIYDRLVKVRDRMAKKMGYENYIDLGYHRLGRLSFDREMVEAFRANVQRDIVPVVARLKTENGKRMGIENMMMYDDSVSIPGGDPKPSVDTDGIFAAAKEMYHELSPETGAFIDMMLENDAFDVLSRKNKWGGGYCTSFPKYKQPFILANFNGTAADVDVVTHEAGHAFADYMTANNKFGVELSVGGMETAETHSMSMEFFAWKYIDKFFGANEKKYRYMHAFDAFSFIPYGTMVDHFQHEVYAHPEMTPAQRNTLWNELEKQYRPYMKNKGMNYFEKGTRWQYQMHIYESPFYYIDYCLAQVVAFEFLLESQKDYDSAFKRYVKFLSQGGEKLFEALIKEANLKSPFQDGALKEIAQKVEALLVSIMPA